MCAERYRLSTAMHPPRAAHTAAALTVEPRARVLHIGARRAHAHGLPAMLQLCSPSMSRQAQIKDQLELDDEEGRRRDDWSGLRTASGRATPIADSFCRHAASATSTSWSFASVDPTIRTPYTLGAAKDCIL